MLQLDREHKQQQQQLQTHPRQQHNWCTAVHSTRSSSMMHAAQGTAASSSCPLALSRHNTMCCNSSTSCLLQQL